jgi:TolB protein
MGDWSRSIWGNSNSRDGQLSHLDPIQLTNDTAADVDPDISPNGKEIVFTANQTVSGNNNIFLRNRYGVVRNLTNDNATDEWARWSPDGKRIVFDSNRNSGVFEIYVMNRDGSSVTELTAPPVLGRYPSWSPDGTQIVFRRGVDIYAINADASGTPTQLTSEVPPSFAQMPVWTPDGRYIAFMSFREGYCSVFRMNADGSEPTNLTPKDPRRSTDELVQPGPGVVEQWGEDPFHVVPTKRRWPKPDLCHEC